MNTYRGLCFIKHARGYPIIFIACSKTQLRHYYVNKIAICVGTNIWAKIVSNVRNTLGNTKCIFIFLSSF